MDGADVLVDFPLTTGAEADDAACAEALVGFVLMPVAGVEDNGAVTVVGEIFCDGFKTAFLTGSEIFSSFTGLTCDCSVD